MFRDKKENEKIKEGQGIKKAQLNIWPIKALPNYGELSRFDPAPLYALLLPHNTAPLQPPGASSPSRPYSPCPLLEPLLPDLPSVSSLWLPPLLDLPSPASLLLPHPSRYPLPFLTIAATPLLDPYARFPTAALQEPEPNGMEAEMGC